MKIINKLTGETLATIITSRSMTYYVGDDKYIFAINSVDGEPVLAATYERNGESHTIWTAEQWQLPADESEAAEWIKNLDWAVETESMLDSNRDD